VYALVERWRRAARAARAIVVIYRGIIGGHYPTMTAVQVSALIEDRAKVEIEVTAVVPDRDATA